jgi:hypothetical protein
VFSNCKIRIFHFFDTLEVSNFLNNLEFDKTYVVSLELINLETDYCQGDPVITLSDPIIVSNKSNPDLISDYLLNQVIKTYVLFSIEDNQINLPKILVKYTEINLDLF